LEFVRFILSDDKYVAQLWSIGHSYVRMKEFNRERELLTPLVIFQVRGSVSATGGHEPEKRLRAFLRELGLVPDVDYNKVDVVISGDELIPVGGIEADRDDGEASNDVEVEVEVEVKERNQTKKRKVKTRAYDFVLPFKTPGWGHRLFVQSQYYAGDSGSVSHKNVDQTSASRRKVLQHYETPLFIEYVDGAGYFSSLNGDLKSLLSMDDTHDFVQVRSAPIRLRRVLQEIGFLTSLEIEHSILRTDGKRDSVAQMLKADGYVDKEIERCVSTSVNRGLIREDRGSLIVLDERRPFARRMLLLDSIACSGSALQGAAEAGYLLIPGYGPFYGMKLVDLLKVSMDLAPGLAPELAKSEILLADIQWLEEQKYAISS
jgi:hypothetical protein